jgi:hypothetical protein
MAGREGAGEHDDQEGASGVGPRVIAARWAKGKSGGKMGSMVGLRSRWGCYDSGEVCERNVCWGCLAVVSDRSGPQSHAGSGRSGRWSLPREKQPLRRVSEHLLIALTGSILSMGWAERRPNWSHRSRRPRFWGEPTWRAVVVMVAAPFYQGRIADKNGINHAAK